jgi:two-component system phosphate regulon sensor histidine kinase PhoR
MNPAGVRIIMLRPRTLFWKLFLGTSLLIVLVLCACTWLILTTVDRFREAELTSHLRAQATTIRHAIRDKFDRTHAAELDHFAKNHELHKQNRARITMILRDGEVLADSEANPPEMESHADRPEVLQALAEGWGQNTRYSQTVEREMKYVAVRVEGTEAPVGVVRISMGLRTIAQRSEAIRELIWTITLIGLIAAILFAMGLASVLSNPIRRITGIARSLSRGDLSTRARVTGNDEMAVLGQSLNEMRSRLAEQLETIDRQRQTLESLLAQLYEGVVLAGPDQRVLLINPAAVQWLQPGLDPIVGSQTLVGSPVEQCIPQHDLQGMLLPSSQADVRAGTSEIAAASPDVEQARIKVEGEEGEISLLARASDIALPSAGRISDRSAPDGQHVIGRLLVLTDLTELDRTIQMKMDFASNASHELRTPLTTIRAAVETLMEMDLAKNVDSVGRFLGVIDRQGTRMEEMVSDLLDLSRIESTQTEFEPQILNLHQLLENLRSQHQDRLQVKELRWETDIPPELDPITANPYLLRTILDNLVDNAIKFTDAGGQVSVVCRQDRNSETDQNVLSITVTDTGCGIAENEQDRVFERFYQVEKARSGATSGTGLGLSIVRHAISAMGGTVSLVSRPGEGTNVTVTLPQ